MKKTIIAFILISGIIIINACTKDNDGTATPACDNVPKTWSADVSPIITTFCNQTGCHAAGSMNGPGPLTNHSEVFSNRAAIRDAVATGRMPQNTSLSTAQKNSIICWIDSGAPNN